MSSERILKKVVVLSGSLSHEQVKKLADELASFPDVQVWVEDNYEVQISGIPPIFKGIGSDTVSYSNGWLRFRKFSLSKYTSETVNLTIFFPSSQEESIEKALQAMVPLIRLSQVRKIK
ncbi:MAG: hypothetical protein QXZ02_04490 [Candidatus Bathyarchaeia archaeon]